MSKLHNAITLSNLLSVFRTGKEWKTIVLLVILTIYLACFIQNDMLMGAEPTKDIPLLKLEKPSSEGSRSHLKIDDINRFSEKNDSDEQKTEGEKNSTDGPQWISGETISLESQSIHCADVKELIEECRASLEPYSNLFGRYTPMKEWVDSVNKAIMEILLSLEKSPEDARTQMKLLQKKLLELDQYKAELIKRDTDFGAVSPGSGIANSKTPKNEDELPLLLSRYKIENQLEIIDGFRQAMERRIHLWSFAADYFEARQKKELVPTHVLTSGELVRLRKQTEDVRLFFGITPTGQGWRKGFEIDLLIEDLDRVYRLMAGQPVFKPMSTESEKVSKNKGSIEEEIQSETVILAGRINAICHKIEVTPMSPSQREVLLREPFASWSRLLKTFQSDRGNARDLLWAFERYERTSGVDAGSILLMNAWLIKCSVSPVSQDFGKAIDQLYNHPNTKVYISEMLINRLLPIRDPEFDVVQETILNNPVAGRRRTDTEVAIRLIPDPDRLLMKLAVSGKMVAETSSDVFPAKVYNASYAAYYGEKGIEWKNNGIVYTPAAVQVMNSNQLSGVQTEVDFVPIIGDLVRGLAKGQYELKQPDIQKATRDRITIETSQRIDREAGERLTATNTRMNQQFFKRLEHLGLTLKMQDSRTTSDWLLASMRLASDNSLGSQTTEPPTLPGAFADLKVHESTINTFLSRLDLAGKSFTVQELLKHIATKLELSSFSSIRSNNEELYFTFEKEDPVTIRFVEDRVQIRLVLEATEVGSNVWENITVIVSYRPMNNEAGQTVLVRDGLIRLEGPLSIRAQVPLRAIFSKVFPADKQLPLEPKIFRNDERFTGLGTGLCRISRGWFAISIKKNQE